MDDTLDCERTTLFMECCGGTDITETYLSAIEERRLRLRIQSHELWCSISRENGI